MRAGRAIWVVLLAAVSPGVAGAEEAPRFRFSKPLLEATDAGAGVLAVTLDGDVYAATRDGFPDLRLFGEEGGEIPYTLERVVERRGRMVRRDCASRVVSLREVEGGALEIEVRLADDAPSATGLTVLTPLADFERRVSVEGAKGDGDWSPLVADALIFDYRRYMDVRQLEIALPANDARRFRLVVDRGVEDRESPFRELIRGQGGGREDTRAEATRIERVPFRIDRIEAWREDRVEQEGQPRKTSYPLGPPRVEQDAEAKLTRLRVASRREPLTGLILETSSRNFIRPVSVRVPVARGLRVTWKEIALGTIRRLDLPGLRREELRLDFPETRAAEYEVLIENEDNPPLAITGLSGEGNAYRLAFLGSGERPARLAYGSDDAGPPRYETSALLAALGPGYHPAQIALGAQVEDPGYQPSRGQRGVPSGPVFLFLALAVMVAVLAWALLSLGRKVKGLPDDEV